MIKRLKWNVLYAESAQDGSDLSDSSAESIERGSTTAQAVLDQLAINDPNFAAALGRQSYPSSSDEEDTHQQNVSAQHPAASKEEQLSNDSDDANYAEWRECDLCPGKRFLNDADVQTHLSSRHHKRALKRFEARTLENDDNHTPNQRFAHANLQAFATLDNSVDIDRPQNPASSRLADKTQKTPSLQRETENTQQVAEEDQPSPNDGLKMTEEQQRKANKRKAAVKRRLLRLKQKKWKRTEQGQGSAGISTRKEEEQKLNNPASEEGEKTDREREKVRKIGNPRAKQETQDPPGVKLNDHNAGAEASPSLQKRERKKRSKRKSKEGVGENGVNGSMKRKKLRRELETLPSGDVPQRHSG